MFAKDLFALLEPKVDITLYKGGGESTTNEIVVDHIPRYSDLIKNIKVFASDKWKNKIIETKRQEIEFLTFGYAALKPLIENEYDVIHCLEKEVCQIIYDHRNFFMKIPKIIFSNGGALKGKSLPDCDTIQEYTLYNYNNSIKSKAVYIPHGVDLDRFDPKIDSSFRKQQNIPEDALFVLSVGTICYQHKRMDYLIKEVSKLQNAYLVVVGQTNTLDSDEIIKMGENLMPGRTRFLQVSHNELPQVYRAADIFALASLFETFGIVYIEAMAMKLPVIATNHINQRQIIQKGIFLDMRKKGEITRSIQHLSREKRYALGKAGRMIVEDHYDIKKLTNDYIRMYMTTAEKQEQQKRYLIIDKIKNNLLNLLYR